MTLIKNPLTVILLLCSYVVFSQATISGELRKWHTVSITFNGPNTSENDVKNPFLEYRLNVTFTGPSGNTFVVPGFYAADGNAAETGASSGNKWTVRFTPNETGQWSYNASFRTGTNVAISLDPNAGTPTSFNGATGNFSISGTNKSAPDNRAKGRLNYVGERYLKFEETGEYFLKAGSDSPENLLAYGDFDNTTNSKTWAPHVQDWNPGDPVWHGNKGKGLIGAINYLAEKGMNAFSFLPMNVIGDGKDVWPWAATSHDALDGKTGPDVANRARYDVSKLEQWEILFSHADSKGMYLHFKTQETENNRLLDNGPLGGQLGTNRKLYYRELIARFGHHLALNWNIGEENTNLTSQRLEFAQWFHDVDPYDHHIVLHTYPFQSNDVYPPLLGNTPKYTGASIQENIETVHSEILQWIQQSTAAGKPWVVANDEQGHWTRGVTADANYPGDKGIQDDNRYETRHKILWGTLMAGGAGVEYYFGYETGETDLSAHDWRSRDTKWNDAKKALDFFGEHLPYWEMHSNDGLTSATNDYCLAKQGEIYAIYLPTGGSTNLNLSSANGTYAVRWYNPKNGGSLAVGSVSEVTGGSSVSIGNPPNSSSTDWVALVKRKEGAPSGGGGTASTGCDADYEEQNGIVVIEAEDLVVPTGWTNKSTTAGFSGNGYLEWEGGDNFNLPGVGVISAQIKINQTGTYLFEWRNKVGHGTNFTESNDSWLRFPDADDFYGGKDNGSVVYPHGSGKTPTPHGAGGNGWFKVNSSGGIVWNWTTWTNDGDGHHVYVTFNTPGVYTMEISGRSNHHLIDRIVLSKNIGNPRNLTLPETPCQETENTTISVTGISVTPESISLNETKNIALSAQVSPANATNKTVLWSSSDPEIATVDQNGTVTAHKEGSATITARTQDGDFTDTSFVQVNAVENPNTPVPVTSITVFPKDATLTEGNLVQLNFQILPENATNKTVIWSSSDTEIVTVDPNGIITAIKEGSATITARTEDGGFTDTSNIQVTPDSEPDNSFIGVTGIILSPKEATLEEGNILALSFEVSPADATNKKVLWASSDTDIATVDPNGSVSAKAEGFVTITATTEDGNFTDTSSVQVISSGVSEPGPEPNPDCDSDYVEDNNLVVIEAENLNTPTGWSNKSTVDGYTGNGYLEWEGGDNFNTPGAGLITTKIKINEAGTYLFQWRTKVGHGTNPTESNDTWLRFPDADDFYGGQDNGSVVYPKGSGKTPLTIGSGSEGWFKVNSSAPVANWTWTTYTNDGNGHNIYVTFNTPGTYTMEIAGRSNHHLIDRIVLSKNGDNATELSIQETPCGTEESIGPSLEIENSSAIEGHNIDFTMNLSKESLETIVLDIEFINETANSQDYIPNIETITFAPGEVSKILSIPTRNDNDMEEDETFRVGVKEVKSGTVADFSDIGIGTIIDEDAPLNVFPNPARANSIVQLDGMLPGLYEIALFSMSGELIQKEMATVEGTHQLSLGSMTRGLYIVRAANIERSYTGKVVIQ